MRDIGSHLKALAAYTGLLGALSYGIGWLYLSRVFGVLGIHPERAGFEWTFVVVRVSAPVILLTAVIVPPFLAVRDLAARRQFHLRHEWMTVALFLGLISALVASAIIAWALSDLSGLLSISFVSIILLVSDLLIRRTGFISRSIRLEGVVDALGGLLFLVLLARLAITVPSPKSVANSVRSGEAVELSVAGLELLRLPAVEIAPEIRLDPSFDGCAILLGEGLGSFVLYERELGVIWVPIDGTSLTQRESCPR